MHIVFRFDGSSVIGMGHLMRCLTLADLMRQHGVEIAFLCTRGTARVLRQRWPNARCFILSDHLSPRQDARQCQVQLHRWGIVPDWLIVDHYRLGKEWERQMRRHTKRLMAIDDLAREHVVDMLLDANFTREGTRRYCGKVPGKCYVLMGPRYALLRKSVGHAATMRAPSSEKRIFVCFGGSDPVQATQWVLELLHKVLEPAVAVDVVVGCGYVGKDALVTLCELHPNWNLHVNHPHPETLMAQATIAVGAGGTMTWERCALGLPSVVMSIADNQRDVAMFMGERGLIAYLGDYGAVSAPDLLEMVKNLLANEGRRFTMAAACRAVVDVKGAAQVVRAMFRKPHE